MIYSPIQIAFIKFLKACIAKNKAYGYINLTNKQIAERFTFKDKKYSLDYISKLVQQTKHEFTLQSKGSTRYILLKNAICQTVQSNLSDSTEQVQSKYTAICQTVQPRQETLEPQGLQDPLLSIKNQDQERKQPKEKSPLDELQLALDEFTTYRESLNKPLSDTGLKNLVKRLDVIGKDTEERILLLREAISSGLIEPVPARKPEEKEKTHSEICSDVEGLLKEIGYSGQYKDWLVEQFLKAIEGKKIHNMRAFMLSWLKDKDPPRSKPVEYETIRQPEAKGQASANKIIEEYGSIANYRKHLQERINSDNRNLEPVHS